jgi:hypothetical protein
MADKSLWDIAGELYQGFDNNPRNTETFDAMANMNPLLAAYRGGKTLKNVDPKVLAKALKNEAYGISNDADARAAGKQLANIGMGVLDIVPMAGALRPAVKPTAKALGKALEMTADIPAGMSIKNVNLNEGLLNKFLETKKFTPEEFSQYEINAKKMTEQGLHDINRANAKANPYHEPYKNQFNIDAWRGMNEDVSAMNPNVGSGARADTGVWAVDNPYNASTYAGKINGGVIYPLKLRNQQLATVDVGNNNWNRIPLSSNPVKDTIIRNSDDTDYGLHEYLGDHSIFDDYASTNDVATVAKQNAHNKGIQFENVRDIGPSPQGIDMSKIDEFANVYTMFDPSSIRSVNAAFDPLRHKSNDILAGVGASLPYIDYSKDKNKK